MGVGVHGLDDDGRLQEYVEAFGGERFEAYERFLRRGRTAVGAVGPGRRATCGAHRGVGRVTGWRARARYGAGHPEIYGVVLCASPGGGFTPSSGPLPSSVPRTYLVGGTQEQWFLDNATTWADAVSKTGADVVIEKRNGGHGGAFWYDELPLMVSWAFRR